MSIEAGQRYKITNAKGGTALDLSSDDEHTIAGWDWHGGDNQIWETSTDGGVWHFRSAASGKYLALEEGDPRDGLRVIASDEPVGWHIWPDAQDESVHRICLPDTVFNIDLTNYGDSAGGTAVEIWGRWEAQNQCWRFEQV